MKVKVPSLLLLLLPTAVESLVLARLRCFLAFVRRLRFDPHDYDNYDNFFDDNSFLVLAQTEEYYGPEAMKEYVKITDKDFSAYLGNESIAVDSELRFLGFDRSTDECTYYAAVISGATFNPATTSNPPTSVFGITNLIAFRFRDLIVSKFFYYWPIPHLDYLYNEVLYHPNTRDYVCNIVATKCAEVLVPGWTKEECLNLMESLPGTEGEMKYLDGNSHGCRVIHAFLADSQPEVHCPHLSFTPMEDPDGNIKCQESGFRLPETYFSQEHIEMFEAFLERNGIDPVRGWAFSSELGLDF